MVDRKHLIFTSKKNMADHIVYTDAETIQKNHFIKWIYEFIGWKKVEIDHDMQFVDGKWKVKRVIISDSLNSNNCTNFEIEGILVSTPNEAIFYSTITVFNHVMRKLVDFAEKNPNQNFITKISKFNQTQKTN